MRSVKQVPDLTGISVRTLHYYGEIGVLKPSQTTDTGYRLYDDKALENQKKLLVLKRNRIDELIGLIDNTIKGEDRMSFKAFDMSAYYNVLEQYLMKLSLKKENLDAVNKYYGGEVKYNELLEKIKSNETEIANRVWKCSQSILGRKRTQNDNAL